MNPKYKKVYTCTTVAFPANEWFFCRDSGLISRVLRTLGVQSKVIMPLPGYDDDLMSEILRTEYKNLESAAWWKSQEIDGLVLYSWAAPRYRKVAKAVRDAGIRLVIHFDSSGYFIPVFPAGTPFWRKLYTHFIVKVHDVFRSKHLSYADTLTMSEPVSRLMSRKMFYGKFIEDKCFPMPCPVAPFFRYAGQAKAARIVAVGRWDDAVKRPWMLMDALAKYYQKGGTAETIICGPYGDDMSEWYASLPETVKSKITIKGFTRSEDLYSVYAFSQVSVCTSESESTHIVSAEGLCCGCSVVVPNRPKYLSNVLWYTTKDSGTIAAEDTPESLADALLDELALWEKGFRNPQRIAENWQPIFLSDLVFNKIFE